MTSSLTGEAGGVVDRTYVCAELVTLVR